jgi:hypothetical protein
VSFNLGMNGPAVRPYGEGQTTRQDTESVMQPQEAMLYM